MNELEKMAWAEEPPRGEKRLTPEEEFRRAALAWAGKWLQRAKTNTNLSKATPFVIVLADGPLQSPALDPYLAGRTTEERTLWTYDCPMPLDVIVVNSNLRSARGYRQGFGVASDIIQHCKACSIHQRHFLVIDPAQLAYGYHDAKDSVDDFGTVVPELDGGPITFTKEFIDEHLTRFHEQFVKNPDKPYGVRFWEDRSALKTISEAEFEVQRSLIQYFVVLTQDDRYVTTDTEVPVPTGRADVRLIAAKPEGLRAYFLELKVLREQDGPSKRDENVRTCIGQARARYDDARISIEVAFACCYDASQAQMPFDGALQRLADQDIAVMLRQYPVFSERYSVASS